MSTDSGLQLRSIIRKNGELELSLQRVAVAEPGADEVVVRIEGTPINPSDLGLLFGAADMSTAKFSGTPASPVVTATVPEKLLKSMTGRLDQSMPVGNEGAGIVVKAGSSPAAQALLGKIVAILGGAMYAQYRTVKAVQCLVLPEGTTPADGASCFVNPLTALGMVETMRLEGHKGLVHTAAASNLGQMLNRLCIEDNVPLVCIVRKKDQEELLRSQGATWVCNSTSSTFIDDLTKALVATGATLAFDAIGGGRLANQILTCMETAATMEMKEYSRYGSPVHKQVYMYGMLDRSPVELTRSYGMAWGVGGWLVTPFLQKIGQAAAQKLRERVAAGLKTTFASQYTKEISLVEALQPAVMGEYAKFGTGEKYLINPNRS
jgi:NADPH:quinone reductase